MDFFIFTKMKISNLYMILIEFIYDLKMNNFIIVIILN